MNDCELNLECMDWDPETGTCKRASNEEKYKAQIEALYEKMSVLQEIIIKMCYEKYIGR